MDESEAATIRAVLSGDTDRYAELVEKYRALALRLAFSLLGNYEDAKDASQEAFVSAFRSLGRFRATAQFSTWLYRIIVNECKDVHKWRMRHPVAVASAGDSDSDAEADGALFMEVADPAADPAHSAANQELAVRISGAIQDLPVNQRIAFVLHHVRGFSLDETAAVMGCRVGTVKSHVFRATERLRLQLAPWLPQG